MIELDHIYNENCIDTLKRMENDSIDLVITSPPYNMNLRIKYGKYLSRAGEKGFSAKYEDFDDDMPIDEFYNFHSTVLKELLRVSGRVFYNIQIVTGSKRAFFKLIGAFSNYLKDIIIWDKLYAQPAMQSEVLNSRYELILVFEKEYPISRQFTTNCYFERGTLDNLWTIKPELSRYEGHSAVFPEDLIENILRNFSKEGDIVYDPFLGTGTTAVVAKKLDRHYIGSEINPTYIEVANYRLSTVQMLLPI